jgi:apolipoprotein N-acyltransferase
MNYLINNDPKLAAIYAKINQNNGSSNLTAEELDYQQKTIGFVNSMASLSPAEKATYDKMVASGNTAAAAGMSVIAFERATLGHTASTKDGVTYDPTSTAITPENIVKYFSQSFSDPTGKIQSQFQALIQYLQNNLATA